MPVANHISAQPLPVPRDFFPTKTQPHSSSIPSTNFLDDNTAMATTEETHHGNYPLKDITAPHPHDVLCGRGGGTNNHIGNSHWRMLVAANKQLYVTLPKRQKMLLSRSIVNAVRSQNPPGRFLQRDSKTNKWFDVGDQRAQEKTSQALREGAPDIRKKVAGKSDVDSTEKSTTSSDDEHTESAASEQKTTSTAQTPPAPAPVAPKPKDGQVSTPAQAPAQVPAPAPSPFPQTAGAPVSNHSTPLHYGTMPPLGHYPMGMHPGGMPQFFMPSMASVGPHGMVLYAGPNMQPVQVYPTMVVNEHGMMVPGMSMVPASPATMMSMPMSHFPYPMQQTDSVTTPPASTVTHHQSQSIAADDTKKTPTFDEFVAAPPDTLDSGGLSYGSAMMPDPDLMKSHAVGTSFGSMMSYKYSHNVHQDTGGHVNDEGHVPPAIDSLEPIGISFGDISMMSNGTNRLEAGGTSFGTMMSISTMPDGGLELVGTSFGSLSLDPVDREQLFQRLELTGGGPMIPPMFPSEDKATGNLLECSDTESEDSESHTDLVAQKSEAWEKMRMSVAQTQLRQSHSKGTVDSKDLMPPPPTSGHDSRKTGMNGTVLSVPATNLNRDFSQLSAWEDDDDDDGYNAVPPPQLEKQESDGDEGLVGYLSQQPV